MSKETSWSGKFVVCTMMYIKEGNSELYSRITRTIRALTDGHGLQVIITDGGSFHGYRENIARIPGVTMLTGTRGVSPQLRKSLEHAIQDDAFAGLDIIYLEPDKCEYVENGHLNRLAETFIRQPVGCSMALSARAVTGKEDDWWGYPMIQREMEMRLNGIVTARLFPYQLPGPTGIDYLYGPRVFSREVAETALLLYSELAKSFTYWEIIMFLTGIARRLKGIYFLPGEMPAPIEDLRDLRAIALLRFRHCLANLAGLEAALSVKHESLKEV